MSHFQKKHLLTSTNQSYQRILDELFVFLTRNDHIGDESTVKIFLAEEISSRTKKGVISAKTACVVGGLEEVVYLTKKHTKLTPRAFTSDGNALKSEEKLLSLRGTAKDILSYERALLNILQRMSGIATETAKYVATIKKLHMINPPLIAATRKTPWMHLDKKSVAVAGGVTHRLNLRDGILLKDNHLALLQQSRLTRSLRTEGEAISYAIEHADIADESIVIEVEVKSDEAAYAAVDTWRKRNLKNPFVIMLDNFTPERARKVIQAIRHPEFISGSKKMLNQVHHDKGGMVFFEASGGITLENIKDFAKTGVDVISIGALTHSPKAVDLSMDVY